MHCSHRGGGDAILFLHGMATNGTLWDGIIDQMCGTHRCFAVDLPGMGKTPFLPYSAHFLDRFAEQIEEVRVRHGVTRWHVVGHDAGSAIAVHYASRFPGHVGCLALLSAAIFPELKPYFLLNPLRRPVVGEVLAPLLNFLFWKVAMRRALMGVSTAGQRKAFYQPFSGPTGAWQFMRVVRWGKPESVLGGIPAELADLPAPTLLFHGSRDLLPAAFADRAAALLRDGRVVTMDAGHFLPLDRPKEVAASLGSFFLQHRSMMGPVASRRRRRRRAGSAGTSMPVEASAIAAGGVGSAGAMRVN